ncbi:hypothetical protein [Mesobacillus jeotgali]|uniref:hypothetical protein n=1 Tax=Mesobacillus jeotgali TaxID=129985 RepID=UPI0009A6B3FC|nr:hypothetical protein [Mesobacillus jeotgali]
MEKERIKEFDKIVELGEQGQKALNQYWLDYSLYASVEYLMMVLFLVGPLILLFFKIDRTKIFRIAFFGYSIHMIFGYQDLFGRNMGYWNYPFPVIPVLPGISLDSSLIPVTFMLVYQWTINHKKNYYLYAILTAVILSFGFKPLLVGLGLFKMYEDVSYFHLFISYLSVLILAKLLTNLFVWMKNHYESHHTFSEKEPN